MPAIIIMLLYVSVISKAHLYPSSNGLKNDFFFGLKVIFVFLFYRNKINEKQIAQTGNRPSTCICPILKH